MHFRVRHERVDSDPLREAFVSKFIFTSPKRLVPNPQMSYNSNRKVSSGDIPNRLASDPIILGPRADAHFAVVDKALSIGHVVPNTCCNEIDSQGNTHTHENQGIHTPQRNSANTSTKKHWAYKHSPRAHAIPTAHAETHKTHKPTTGRALHQYAADASAAGGLTDNFKRKYACIKTDENERKMQNTKCQADDRRALYHFADDASAVGDLQAYCARKPQDACKPQKTCEPQNACNPQSPQSRAALLPSPLR